MVPKPPPPQVKPVNEMVGGPATGSMMKEPPPSESKVSTVEVESQRSPTVG